MNIRNKYRELEMELHKHIPGFTINIDWNECQFHRPGADYDDDDYFVLENEEFPENCGIDVACGFPTLSGYSRFSEEQKNVLRNVLLESAKINAYQNNRSLLMATIAQSPRAKKGQITEWAPVFEANGWSKIFEGKNRNSGNIIHVYIFNLLEWK